MRQEIGESTGVGAGGEAIGPEEPSMPGLGWQVPDLLSLSHLFSVAKGLPALLVSTGADPCWALFHPPA